MAKIKTKTGAIIEVPDDMADYWDGRDGVTVVERPGVVEAGGDPVEPEPAVPAELEEPKASGSKVDWQAYAASLGVDVFDGASRDDIRTLVADALAEVDDPDE